MVGLERNGSGHDTTPVVQWWEIYSGSVCLQMTVITVGERGVEDAIQSVHACIPGAL